MIHYGEEDTEALRGNRTGKGHGLAEGHAVHSEHRRGTGCGDPQGSGNLSREGQGEGNADGDARFLWDGDRYDGSGTAEGWDQVR
jgi:hypothetical protein